MSDRIKIFAVAAKLEATPGTDSTPTFALNAVRVVGVPELVPDFLEKGDRADAQHGGMGRVGRAAPSGRWASIDLVMEVAGAGAAYAANVLPPIDPFLMAAGLIRTVTTTLNSEKVEYSTLDDWAGQTLTLYLHSANRLYRLVGCIAKPKLVLTVNQRALWQVTVVGRMATDPAANTLSGLTLPNVAIPTWKGELSIGAWAHTTAAPNKLLASKLELDFGTTEEASVGGGSDGLDAFVVTDRALRASAEVEQVALTTFDPFAIAKQGQSGSGQTATAISAQISSSKYNRCSVLTGQWAIEHPKMTGAGIAKWALAGDIVARSITAAGAGNGRELLVTFD